MGSKVLWFWSWVWGGWERFLERRDWPATQERAAYEGLERRSESREDLKYHGPGGVGGRVWQGHWLLCSV